MTTTSFPSVDHEFARIVDELTRRGFLAGTLSATVLGVGACASDQSAPSAANSSPGGWSFTDDRGKVVDKQIGALPEHRLRSWLESKLPKEG